jgi:hypothetical protein
MDAPDRDVRAITGTKLTDDHLARIVLEVQAKASREDVDPLVLDLMVLEG